MSGRAEGGLVTSAHIWSFFQDPAQRRVIRCSLKSQYTMVWIELNFVTNFLVISRGASFGKRFQPCAGHRIFSYHILSMAEHTKLHVTPNLIKRLLKCRQVKGSEVGSAKLTETKVVKILQMLKQGIMCKKIADIFQVHVTQIYRIKHNIAWKHVQR